jgi:hypothetical protein
MTTPTSPPPDGNSYSSLRPGMAGPLYLEPPNSAMAIASMVMGFLGFMALPLIGSILAIVFGNIAQNEIRDSQGSVGGDTFARVGLILGYIGLGLFALGIILLIVFLALVTISFPVFK